MASLLEIAALDPFADAEVDAWWDVYAAAELADRGVDAPLWTREETRSEIQQQSQTVERHVFLARRGGEIVAAGKLALTLKDNTHTAAVGVYLLPAHRRQGIGSELLAFLEEAARAARRSVLHAEASWPYAASATGEGIPGVEFARRHGFTLALGDVQSRLALPVPEATFAALEAEAGPRAAGYTLRSWVGPVPADIVSGWAILDAAVATEAPTGDLDREPVRPEVADVREHEELLRRQNRTSFGTVAVTATGDVAAYTQLVVSGDDGNAYQWGTLVREEDRGHRLGFAVKLANLRMLQQEAPDVTAVYTYNAGVNEHMLAINTRLGFAPSERMAELQKRIA